MMLARIPPVLRLVALIFCALAAVIYCVRGIADAALYGIAAVACLVGLYRLMHEKPDSAEAVAAQKAADEFIRRG